MRIVHSQFTRGHKVRHESPRNKKRVSMTVPNEALTVRDIVTRFIKKQPMPELDKMAKAIYMGEDMTHDSPDMNKIRDMDKMEKIEFANSFQVKYKEKPEPQKLTREEYEKAKATKLTFDEWDKLPPPGAAVPPPA